MTQTSKKYWITAYDHNHDRLWIDLSITSTDDDADGDHHTDHVTSIVATYADVLRGYPIDPETGLPVTTIGKRDVAYFRTHEDCSIMEIWITRSGRRSHIRNYQTRRPGDKRAAHILGFPPISTDPYLDIRHNGRRLEIVFGEGDPNTYSKPGHPNTDRWGDPVYLACSASRVFAYETEGNWHGWTFNDYVNHNNHMALVDATRADVERHLRSTATEMVNKYGADITRW